MVEKRKEVIDRRNTGDAHETDWWNKDSDKAAQVIYSLMKQWDSTNGAGIQYNNMLYYRMYSGRWLETMSVANFVWQQYGDGAGVIGQQHTPLTLNVTASTIDTLKSKLGKNQIKPTAITSGSIYEQRQRTQGFNKAVFGMLREGGAYIHSINTLANALIFGTGESHVYACHESGKVKIQSVFTDEILVDPGDGYYGTPRNKYRRKFVAKRQLQDAYPDKAEQIDKVEGLQLQSRMHDDMILVVEAWHLGYGDSPGRHMICIDGLALMDDEDWRYNRFPHAVLRYEKLPTGYWGQGVAEKLKGIQIEINFTLARIREAMRRFAKPWVFIPRGSKVNPKHMDNEIGSMVFVDGDLPVIQQVQAVSPDQYRHLENLYAKAFEIVGLSQLSAQSQKPAGLDAAVALREYQDIETERFAALARGYEQYFVDLARSCVDVMDHEFGDDYVISTHSKDEGLQKVRWGDVKLPHDAYLIQVWPQSALPQKPEARLQRVIELLQGGLIDPQMALEMLDFPDLDSHMNLILAPSRVIFQMLEKMAFEDTEQILPEPNMDLQQCLKIGNGYYNWCLLKEFPDEKLSMIREFIDHANRLIDSQQTMQAEETGPAASQQIPAPEAELTQGGAMPVETMGQGV